MFTQADKAHIAAIVGAIAAFVGAKFGFNVSDEINAIITGGILWAAVYFTRNKTPVT